MEPEIEIVYGCPNWRLRFYEPAEPDFDNPEHQKELLAGKRYVTCKHCDMYSWVSRFCPEYLPIHFCLEPDKGEDKCPSTK